MSRGRVTMGFKPEVLQAYEQKQPRRLAAGLWRVLILCGLLIMLATALVMTTDIEELLLPRTIILRGNRLSGAQEVLEIAGLPQRISLRSLLPQTRLVPEQRSRWIRSISTQSMLGRRMLLSVDERMPVLPLAIGGNPYWICSDGEIVRRNPELDTDEQFTDLNKLPLVTMADSGIDAEYDIADMLMLVTGCCRELLNGRISGIQVKRSGELTLSTDRGLLVQLGIPEDADMLRMRMTALAKAIRISDEYRDAVGIDMRNGKVAYLRTSTSE